MMYILVSYLIGAGLFQAVKWFNFGLNWDEQIKRKHYNNDYIFNTILNIVFTSLVWPAALIFYAGITARATLEKRELKKELEQKALQEAGLVIAQHDRSRSRNSCF